MTEEESQQVKSSYRDDLFNLINDRAETLADRVATGGDWHLIESTAIVIWLAHKFLLISDVEAAGFCRQITLGCPILTGKLSKKWQEGFGLAR